MGKEWDRGVPGEPFWREALRVSKPGAHLLAMGGTRTFHRLAVAIEDAGWEIRDTLCWLYGQGFPKGKGCLKPAWEPVIMARKAGGRPRLQVDQSRIGVFKMDGFNPNIGRWPANVCLDEEAAAMVDEQSGFSKSVEHTDRTPSASVGYGVAAWPKRGTSHSDSGGASRFFYCAKASRSEREAGLEGMPLRTTEGMRGNAGPSLVGDDRVRTRLSNPHPTVKPISLMRWLCRLVTPPGGIILDPFAGSGSTGCAAVAEGFGFIGIEMQEEYVTIARARIDHWYNTAEPTLPMMEGTCPP
jgi:site-specific DNA-methyltransferase (adenine-specific)